jgi:hypothetical protein
MDDFYEKISLIGSKFISEGFEKQKVNLDKILLEGGTVGEKFQGIAVELNSIKRKKTKSYLCAKTEIDEIVVYAKAIKYLR